MRLKDQVAIITGSSRGIGRDIALRLADEGCNIGGVGKTTEPHPKLPGTIYTVAAELEAKGVKALPVACDVREVEAIQGMVAQTLETFGRIDILINNAGALWWEPLLNTPTKRFDLMMDINARAPFFAAQAVIPAMQAQGRGHIINMSPPIDLAHVPYHIGYCISKFGMTLITHGLAEEMKPHGIGVYSLWPRTMIESLATVNWGLGTPEMWRKASIMSDATLEVVASEPLLRTGRALIDEEVLREAGVSDFDVYNCVPGSHPPDLNTLWEMTRRDK
ncbi:MAG: SDR family oxidoreductase [Candidatus Melainabacteria bacterium HGW-Melainabacteria-1]|nr:MAG: SDR family oxidoreductase [Candidatus Melainabacteria bacterium HGW-Melainabacteria-1]